ncbi:hypothetical protein PILCRDRAFT_814126 [Piloderma croceum F 1598]|uniref:Uncharacterized protein n=1 Tax=Piloderma croceum (strain F 1598) TaxID=765440 RepID=A0A0C3GC51_PILCF|nr:hypothetical protein PILCRDRAFT_814126 [Piloderma croceum F 1598]
MYPIVSAIYEDDLEHDCFHPFHLHTSVPDLFIGHKTKKSSARLSPVATGRIEFECVDRSCRTVHSYCVRGPLLNHIPSAPLMIPSGNTTR